MGVVLFWPLRLLQVAEYLQEHSLHYKVMQTQDGNREHGHRFEQLLGKNEFSSSQLDKQCFQMIKKKHQTKTHLFHDCGSDYGSLISFLFVDLLYILGGIEAFNFFSRTHIVFLPVYLSEEEVQYTTVLYLMGKSTSYLNVKFPKTNWKI